MKQKFELIAKIVLLLVGIGCFVYAILKKVSGALKYVLMGVGGVMVVTSAFLTFVKKKK